MAEFEKIQGDGSFEHPEGSVEMAYDEIQEMIDGRTNIGRGHFPEPFNARRELTSEDVKIWFAYKDGSLTKEKLRAWRAAVEDARRQQGTKTSSRAKFAAFLANQVTAMESIK